MSPPKKLELRPIRQIALSVIIRTDMDKVIARIPELDVWDHGSSEREAIDGALNAAVGLFEIMEEQKRLDEFLKFKGFAKRQGLYKTDRAHRRELIQEYVKGLRWSRGDPNKGIVRCIIGILSQCRTVESFSLVQPSCVWSRQYGEETEVKRAS